MGEPAIRPPGRGYSWPPFEEGNTAAVRHGADSERHLIPIVDELRTWLEQVAPWCQAPAFSPTAEAWAWAEARVVLYRRHFDGAGLGLDGDEVAGTERWDRAEARAARLRAELGLSPTALTRLLAGLSAVDAPAAQSGLEALRQAGAAIRAAVAAGALEPAADDDGEGGEG